MSRIAVIARLLALLALLAPTACDQTDPYLRPHVWRPNGANEANLRAMVVVPSDLAVATPAAASDGGLMAAAIVRLREDRVKPLPDSGVAEVKPVETGGTPAAAPPPLGSTQ